MNKNDWGTVITFAIIILVIVGAVWKAVELSRQRLGLDMGDYPLLQKGMSYNDVVRQLGDPDDEIGSGTYVYVWQEADGTRITISFLNDRLVSAIKVLSDGSQETLVR